MAESSVFALEVDEKDKTRAQVWEDLHHQVKEKYIDLES
jgi:hypothetical protein